MFLSETHLPQLLSAEAYRSPEQLERERDALLEPSWHLAGTLAELPQNGDYLTDEILGVPFIVWRQDDKVQAFLNVCAHRFCRLSDACTGHAANRLKCQYHGWEYDSSGQARKIPDARSFRPLENGAPGLRPLRTETVGHLIFVALSDQAPSLRDHLGPGYELAQEVCGGDWHLIRPKSGVFLRPEACNWKIWIENTVESYHVECVHPSTFRSIPAAEDCSTAFGQGWSVFRTVDRDAKLDWLDTLAHRMVGAKRNPEYTHLLVYPNITFGRMSLFSWVDEILPVSPTTSMVRTRGFCYGGKEGTLRARLMQRVLRNWAKTFFQALTDEDSRAVRAVQGGLSSRMLPSGGLLSVREERIFHFQRYVRDALQAAGPRPLRVAPSSGESNLSQSA